MYKEENSSASALQGNHLIIIIKPLPLQTLIDLLVVVLPHHSAIAQLQTPPYKLPPTEAAENVLLLSTSLDNPYKFHKTISTN